FEVMKGSAIAASLALAIVAAGASSTFAQQPPAQPPAAQPKPPATPPKPAPPAPAPAQPAAAPAQPAPAPQPPAPFPAGAKIAYVNPQVIFQNSSDGKAAIARVNTAIQK